MTIKLWDQGAKRAGVASYLIRQSAAGYEVLLVRRAGPRFFGEWFPVEGRIEEGESSEEAALREIYEETSLEPLEFYREQLHPVRSQFDVAIYVFVGFVGPDATVVLNYEHSEHAWLAPREAIQRLPLVEQRDALTRIWAKFISQPPPEPLRVKPGSRRGAA